MELDSEIQASKDKIQKEKGIRVHRWWDHVKGWLWIYMVMDCNWTWKQTDSCIICIKREKHVCSRTLSVTDVVHNYGIHPVSTDGERTWYPMACRFLNLRHHIHSSLEKSLIERTIQYIKDRTENFDDYFPCRLKKCKLKHLQNWLNLFIDYHNNELKMLKWTEPLKYYFCLIFYWLTKVLYIKHVFFFLLC